MLVDSDKNYAHSSQYLIKVPIYDTSADPQYLNFWYNLVQSSQANIALSPYNAPDLTYLTQADVCGSKEFSMDDYVSTIPDNRHSH